MAAMPVNAAMICRPAYSKTVRDSSDKMEATIYRIYGFARKVSHFEVNHSIPLNSAGTMLWLTLAAVLRDDTAECRPAAPDRERTRSPSLRRSDPGRVRAGSVYIDTVRGTARHRFVSEGITSIAAPDGLGLRHISPPETRRQRLVAVCARTETAMDHQPAAPGNAMADATDAAAAERSARPLAPARTFPWLALGLRLFILLLVGGLVVVLAHEWDWWVGSAIEQSTDDAYIEADTTPLAAKVPGYVRQVPVRDFQRVKAGDLLVEIVDDDYRAQLAQAEANVVAARAAIDNIERQKLVQRAMVREAEATIQASEADLTRYHLEAVRQQTLLAQRLAGTHQLTEQAIDNEKRSQATLELSRAQLEQQRQQLNVLDSEGKQARATLEAAQAARDLAAISLGYTRITAPVDGMVGQREVRPGQYVSTGTQVIAVVPLPDVWVVANYKETQMTRIRLGQPAWVTVDAFPGTVLHGHVDSWSPASGAKFSLLPPDNATGNFTKVVQRIPVKIVLDPDPSVADLLRPGMSVIATIDTASTSPEAPPPETGTGAR
jgi:membrane fusion protein, multidrug efflux system